tara:strand:+ start:1063 stop:1800 length:738 start_codon:yes stop_codon:yes gene_type:complete
MRKRLSSIPKFSKFIKNTKPFEYLLHGTKNSKLDEILSNKKLIGNRYSLEKTTTMNRMIPGVYMIPKFKTNMTNHVFLKTGRWGTHIIIIDPKLLNNKNEWHISSRIAYGQYKKGHALKSNNNMTMTKNEFENKFGSHRIFNKNTPLIQRNKVSNEKVTSELVTSNVNLRKYGVALCKSKTGKKYTFKNDFECKKMKNGKVTEKPFNISKLISPLSVKAMNKLRKEPNKSVKKTIKTQPTKTKGK